MQQRIIKSIRNIVPRSFQSDVYILAHLPLQNYCPPKQLFCILVKCQACSQQQAGKRKAQSCSSETTITNQALTALWNPWESQVLNRHTFAVLNRYSVASLLAMVCGHGKSEAWRAIWKKDKTLMALALHKTYWACFDILRGMFGD